MKSTKKNRRQDPPSTKVYIPAVEIRLQVHRLLSDIRQKTDDLSRLLNQVLPKDSYEIDQEEV